MTRKRLTKRELQRSAVALEYDGSGAPRVTAKGRGAIAHQIIETARQHDIPVTQNAELNALLETVELNDEVPAALYVAVAEVLRFAYSLRPEKRPEIEA